MLYFPLTKSWQQHKTARRCKTPMKSNVVSIGLLDPTFGCFYKIVENLNVS